MIEIFFFISFNLVKVQDQDTFEWLSLVQNFFFHLPRKQINRKGHRNAVSESMDSYQ